MLSVTSKKLFWVYSQFNDRVTIGNMKNKMQNIPKMRKMHQNRLKIYYQMLSMAAKKCGGGCLHFYHRSTVGNAQNRVKNAPKMRKMG